MAVCVMPPDAQHLRIMEYLERNLGAPERMIWLKNAVYVEVFGEVAGACLLRLNNVEWRVGGQVRAAVCAASSDNPLLFLHGGRLWWERELSTISSPGTSPHGRELQPSSLGA